MFNLIIGGTTMLNSVLKLQTYPERSNQGPDTPGGGGSSSSSSSNIEHSSFSIFC